jgi:hypothetical protein
LNGGGELLLDLADALIGVTQLEEEEGGRGRRQEGYESRPCQHIFADHLI